MLCLQAHIYVKGKFYILKNLMLPIEYIFFLKRSIFEGIILLEFFRNMTIFR